MIATIQLIEDQPTLVFDEEITRPAGLNVGDTVRLEIRADGVIVMTPTQISEERAS